MAEVSALNVLSQQAHPPEVQPKGAWNPFEDLILHQFESESTLWQSFRAFCQNKSLKINSQADLIEALKSSDFFIFRTLLRTHIAQLPPEQKRDLFLEIVKITIEEESHLLMDRIATLVTDQEVSESIQNIPPNADIKILREQLLKDFQKKQHELSDIAKANQKSLLDIVYKVLDTILMASSFFKLGQMPASAWEASFLLTTYIQLFAMPFLLASKLTLILGSSLLGTVTTFALLATLGLSLYLRANRKDGVKEIHFCENLTALAREGRLEKYVGREKELDQIKDFLISSNPQARLHPLVIGPSQIGKSTLFYMLAQDIASGKIPELKGKELYILHTADLVTTNLNVSPRETLQRILDSIGYDSGRVILFFEELAAGINGPLQQQLNSLFDTSPRSLSFVCASTTISEYEKTIKGTPLDNRVQKIVLDSLDAPKTIESLQCLADTLAPELALSDALFNKIVEKTKNLPQPKSAKDVLSFALTLLKKKETDEKQAHSLAQAKEGFHTASHHFERDPTLENAKLKSKAEELLKAASTSSEHSKKQFDRIQALFQFSLKVKEQLAIQNERVFLLHYFYLQPQIKELLEKERKNLPKIDEALLDRAIASLQKK